MLVKPKAGMHPTTDVTCSREKLVTSEHENICFNSLETVGPCNSHGITESVYVYLSMLLTQLPTHDTL